MPSIQCIYCGYRVILPATDNLCPSCGKLLGIMAHQTTVTVEEDEPSFVVTDDDDEPGPSTAAPVVSSFSSYHSYSSSEDIFRRSRKRFSKKRTFHTEDTDRIVDDDAPRQKQEQAFMAGGAKPVSMGIGALLLKIVNPPPQLRGVLVHQSQQTVKSGNDVLSVVGRELANIIWPVPGGTKAPETQRKTVTMVRIRLEDGRQREAHFSGEFMLGSVALGDEISLWGRRRRGTLMVHRAYNHTTEARISTQHRQDSGGVALVLLAALLIATAVLFYTQGWLVLNPYPQLKLPF